MTTSAQFAAAALAALLALALAPAGALAHGFMFEPPARNFLSNYQYCPHCLSGGGTGAASADFSLTWPASRHGLCGDRAPGGPNDVPGAPGATFTEGQVITISLLITAKHGGRHVFRICDRAAADEACLALNTLQLADGSGPYTWMQRAGGPASTGSYRVGSAGSQAGEVYSMSYKLPDGFSCDACVLQWWWTTGNSCDVPGTPYPTGMTACTEPGPYPEFWNCADVRVVPKPADAKAPGAKAPVQQAAWWQSKAPPKCRGDTTDPLCFCKVHVAGPSQFGEFVYNPKRTSPPPCRKTHYVCDAKGPRLALCPGASFFNPGTRRCAAPSPGCGAPAKPSPKPTGAPKPGKASPKPGPAKPKSPAPKAEAKPVGGRRLRATVSQ
eukprot:scaffold7.g3396.t1